MLCCFVQCSFASLNNDWTVSENEDAISNFLVEAEISATGRMSAGSLLNRREPDISFPRLLRSKAVKFSKTLKSAKSCKSSKSAKSTKSSKRSSSSSSSCEDEEIVEAPADFSAASTDNVLELMGEFPQGQEVQVSVTTPSTDTQVFTTTEDDGSGSGRRLLTFSCPPVGGILIDFNGQLTTVITIDGVEDTFIVLCNASSEYIGSYELIFATPTEAPVVSPTDAPVVPPTEAPVVSPTDAPVVSPTDAPVVSPTEAPVV